MSDRSLPPLLVVDLSGNEALSFAEFSDDVCHAFAELPEPDRSPLCGRSLALVRTATKDSPVCDTCLGLVFAWAGSKHKSPAVSISRPEA